MRHSSSHYNAKNRGNNKNSDKNKNIKDRRIYSYCHHCHHYHKCKLNRQYKSHKKDNNNHHKKDNNNHRHNKEYVNNRGGAGVVEELAYSINTKINEQVPVELLQFYYSGSDNKLLEKITLVVDQEGHGDSYADIIDINNRGKELCRMYWSTGESQIVKTNNMVYLPSQETVLALRVWQIGSAEAYVHSMVITFM